MIRLLLFLIPLCCLGQNRQIDFAAQESRVAVPDVQGMLYPAAVQVLERAGLLARLGPQMASDRPRDTVIAQNQTPRSVVPRGTPVSLTVSTGEAAPNLRVPALVGLSSSQAEAVLGKFKLVLQTAGTSPSSEPAGTILAQNPAAGAELPANRMVTVTVAAAPPPNPQVPYVIGMTLETALQTLRNANLTTGKPASMASNMAAGTVMEQDPAAGQSAQPGASVALTLSAGPLAQPVRVPDLRGQTLVQARETLARSDLELGQHESVPGPTRVGTIFRQSPAAGLPAPPHSKVSVEVSTAVVPGRTGVSQQGAPQPPVSSLPWVIGGMGAVAALAGSVVFHLKKRAIHPSGLKFTPHRDWGTVRLRTTNPAEPALRFTASHGHSRQTIVERSSRKG